MTGADKAIEGSVRGVRFEIDPATLSDMDFLEALYDLQSAYDASASGGDENAAFMAFIPFARRLFGSGWPRIKEELRSSDKPHVVACIEFSMEALDVASKSLGGELKN